MFALFVRAPLSLATIRTEDGFVASMHDLVRQDASMVYHVPFFNPGSKKDAQVSQYPAHQHSDTGNEVTRREGGVAKEENALGGT